jgi:hypothetical protein
LLTNDPISTWLFPSGIFHPPKIWLISDILKVNVCS